ncbi:MAG: HAMP domain-containing protein [Huintestinicola sp.]
MQLMIDVNDMAEYMDTVSNQIAIMMIILILIFISAEVLLTYISGRYLRKAKNVVSSIADGDFSAKIEKSPNDEIGEICTGVNEMARQLEEFFLIKDKNERFYYKFVP